MKIDNFKLKFKQVRFFKNENFEAYVIKDISYNLTTNTQLLIEKYELDVHIVENARSDLLKKKTKNLISFSHQNLIYKMIQVMTKSDKKN